MSSASPDLRLDMAVTEREPDVDEQADARYAEMFRRHYGRVVRWLSALGVPLGELDDLAQEVFIIAHRKRERVWADASLTGWLLGISRRVASTHRRSHTRGRTREEQAMPPAEAASPETAAMRSEAAQLLHDFLATLPEEQRLVFVLYEMDGANATEIAEALALPANTVHSRIRLVRERLARFVARQQAKAKGAHG
ncbi:MAG TPA: RNA polymerase sigma factor [Nannocystaceae bacterium]|nr:RNA polymerase sigma factor [Nannocystaceae bacterium]